MRMGRVEMVLGGGVRGEDEYLKKGSVSILPGRCLSMLMMINYYEIKCEQSWQLLYELHYLLGYLLSLQQHKAMISIHDIQNLHLIYTLLQVFLTLYAILLPRHCILGWHDQQRHLNIRPIEVKLRIWIWYLSSNLPP